MNTAVPGDRHHLTSEQVRAYWEDGALFPLTALSEEEAQSLIVRFNELKARMSNWVNAKQLLKVHLVSKWVTDLATSNRVLDAVESIIGPDILLWGATFFAKQPTNASHVGWHQDLLYWGLEPPDGLVTVWVGLTDSRATNGAMQVIAGSHRQGMREHDNRFDENNMLMSSQNSALSAHDEQNRVTVELSAGQFSMHHGMTLHGSGANRSNQPRIGLALNYIATNVAQQRNDGYDTAMLVRGADHYGHFELEDPPQADFSPEAIERYRKSIAMPSGLATKDDRQELLVNLDKIV